MRWLITGAEGFVGRHLLAHLRLVAPEDEIFALVWQNSPPEIRPKEDKRLHVFPVELRDPSSLEAILPGARPDAVLHLAAASSVVQSWKNPLPMYETNILGQLNLLEALRHLEPMPRVVIASSSEIYGREGQKGKPITEDAPLCPASPYAVTKAAGDLQGHQYFLAFGMPVIRLRLFNHTGPGRPSNFVSSSFARQIAEIEAGKQKALLRVGNLDVERDFSDVRDVARAWRLAAIKGETGKAYNVCSGKAVSIRKILETLLEYSGVGVTVQTDPALLRPSEIPRLLGDAGSFHRATSWSPEIPLKQTLRDLLDDWRQKLQQ